MSFKYLNDSGLAYFWTKIKAYVASLLGSKADDANVVHRTGDETVSGQKKFESAIVSYFPNISRGTNPSVLSYKSIYWIDNTLSVTDEHCFAWLRARVDVSGATAATLTVFKNVSSNVSQYLSIGYNSNGDVYTHAPTPATNDNSTNIATTQWVRTATGDTTLNAASANKVSATIAAGSDANLVEASMAGNDKVRIRAGGASDAGYLEIATADNGTEPIRIAQYSGDFATEVRHATLLASDGNTVFPGILYNYTQHVIRHSTYVRNDEYTENRYLTVEFTDKNNNSLADILYYLNAPANGGAAAIEFRVFGNPNAENSTTHSMGIEIGSSGNAWAFCPTHPSTTENSVAIATTAWVRSATGNTALNAATATKLAAARNIAVSGAVTGSASFDGSSNSTVATVWRSCMVGQSENSHTNPWYKVATWTASETYQDSTIAFFVEGTFAGHASGILKIHIRIDNKKVNLSATEIFWIAGTEGIVNGLSEFVLVCPTGDLPTVELWTEIDENYKHRRFTVLSEGGRTSTGPQWVLLNTSTAGQAASITTAGTQKVSVFLGQAQKVHSTVPISLGGTGATTRTGAVTNLFSEGMTTSNAKAFLVVNDNFVNAGWLSLANVKSLLGLSNYLPLTGGSLTGTLNSTSDIVINGCFFRKNNSVVKGTDPSGSCYWYYYFCDKNGTAYTNNALGLLEGRLDSNGRMHVYLRALKNTASSTSLAELGVLYDKAADTGYAYTTFAPPASSNDNKLPTTAWVRTYASGTYVDLTTTQDIANIKRFTHTISLKSTDIVNTSMPSSNVYKNIYWVDKNNNSIGRFLFYQNSSANGGGKALVLDLSNVSSTPTLHTLLNAGFSNPSTSTDAFIVFGGTVKVVRPSAAGTTLGANSTTQRWGQIYSSSTTISTSDERMKDEITAVPDEVLDCWELVPWMQFKMKDSIAEKGDKARLHNGIIAQTVAKTFKDSGLDASRYGLFCYDEWDEDKNQYDDEGNLIYEGTEAGNLYSIRYEEALCMEAACQRRENARLKKRIADLEERLAALELKVS